MPADHGVGGDDDQALFPFRPESARDYPEDFVEEPDSRFGMLAFQRSQLLTQSQVLKKKSLPDAKSASQRSEPQPKEAKHEREL